MLTSTTRVILAVAALSVLSACGEDPAPVAPGDAGGFQTADSGAALSCTQGQSQPCTCPASSGAPKSGNQQCFNGTWLLCNCQGDPLPPPVSIAGSCLAGRYEGTFKGDYRSGFAFGFGIPVEALDFSGQPGLAFTLNQEQGGACGEFCNYTISDGYVKGTANGAFPFEGILTGTLDCETKKFKGQLEGCYALGVNLGINVGKFIGPVEGNYDGTTHSFTIGSWDVLEKDVAVGFFGEVGGNGSWNAKHNPTPTSTSPPGAPTCTGGMIDAGVAPDSGP